MKTIKFKILLILAIFCSTFSFAQTLNLEQNEHRIRQDTIKFYYQDKFERFVKIFLNDKKKNYKKEESFAEDVLDTEEKAIEYAKLLVLMKLSKIDPNWPKEYTISQDKTSRLWFVNCRFLKAAFGGDVHMIFFKNNCKLLFFYKTS